MAGNSTAAEQEQLEIARIQEQLRLERAKLADEIGSKFDALSAAANGSTSKSSKPRIEKPFVHRPVNLGLGAENDHNGIHIDAQSRQDRRLKGALVGKRKLGDQYEEEKLRSGGLRNDDDNEESRESMLNGKKAVGDVAERGNGANKKKRKADPFAVPVKAKAAMQKTKSTEKPVADTAAEPVQLNGGMSTEKEDTSMGDASLQHLSKKARKKLRKQQRLQEEASANQPSAQQSDDHSQPKVNNVPAPAKPSEIVPTPQSQPRSSLTSKLSGARFRQINETMYTTSSTNTLAMIQNDPIKFEEYHEGFREQVKSWPKVPVKQIFELIRDAQREAESALIVDLGAGEGLLGKWLSEDRSIRPRVMSYDLLDSQDGFVKGLDVAQVGVLPLPVVDVAVFCLSLMATNWVDKIREASRVVRPFGELIIAEVTSRFTDKKKFIEIVESLGFKFNKEDASNTHFIIFTFHKKPSSQWTLPYSSQADLDALVESGQAILKPCIYKRR
ncbi:uncharacterized protein FA14DRAFT_129468 [Meira miltonrushii]